MLDDKASFWTDLMWNETLSYKDVNYQLEMQDNVYNFEVASTELLFQLFDMYEAESKRAIDTPVHWDEEQGILTTNSELGTRNSELMEQDLENPKSKIQNPNSSGTNTQHPTPNTPLALVYPAFDLALKCSHVFNLLDARGAVGVTERAAYINRIRARVRACCLKHVEQYKVPKGG
jgi:glycyl-tRNA synthetase alpha chain